MGELFAFLALLALVGVFHLIVGPKPGAHLIDTNKGEAIPTDDLVSISALGNCAVHAILIRQSGNLYRDLGTFSSAGLALAEVTKSFHRANIDEVRITHADQDSVAVYRRFYNFLGRAEGKKLAGARIVRVGEDRERWLIG